MTDLFSSHLLCDLLRSLYRRFSRHFTPRSAPATWGAPNPEAELALPEVPEERPKGCGWFDSSYELGQGLQVQEHDATTAAQALAAAPLADWLELHLGGWQPPAPAQA